MPPCGVSQQGTVASVVIALGAWQKTHREFFVGTGEAGMVLEGDARGADAAVFRRDAIDTGERRFARVPPILAVEVEGRDEGEHELHTKAAWYLARGVSVVWVVLDATREVLAIGLGGETRYGLGERLPAHPALPGLEPEVAELFEQLG